MEFLETFWASMWGALAGAVVGAFASWLFAHELRRRDRIDSYRATMTAHFARVLDALGHLESHLMRDAVQARGARREALIALRAAGLDARPEELGVTVAAREAIEVLYLGSQDSTRASLIATILAQWWRDETDPQPTMVALGKLAYDDAGKRRPVQI